MQTTFVLLHSIHVECTLKEAMNGLVCCCLPTAMTLASGGSPIFELIEFVFDSVYVDLQYDEISP